MLYGPAGVSAAALIVLLSCEGPVGDLLLFVLFPRLRPRSSQRELERGDYDAPDKDATSGVGGATTKGRA
jgi:hypothetical protein